MNKKVEKTIEGLEKYMAGKLNELHKQAVEDKKELDGFRTKLAILKKYREKTPISISEKKELSKILCFGNLGYCCKKECSWRNAVMEICGISKRSFEMTKEKIGLALMTPPGVIYVGTKEGISEEAIVEANQNSS